MNEPTPLVERLRELLAKATPGPWQRFVGGPAGYGARIGGAARTDGNGTPVIADICERTVYGTTEDNADLIVEAINALPALLDIAEARQSPGDVERVARAIHDARYGNDYPEALIRTWEQEDIAGKEYCARLATAAIRALPDPKLVQLLRGTLAYLPSTLDITKRIHEALSDGSAM